MATTTVETTCGKKRIPGGHVGTGTPSKNWRVGTVFIWSEPFGSWLRWGRISIKPGETGAEAHEREVGEKPDRHTFIFERDM